MVSTWVEYVNDFEVLRRENESGTSTRIVGSRTDEEYMKNISDAVKNAKLFSIEKDTSILLAMTKAPKNNERIMMPFPSIFINAIFTKEELRYYGWDVELGVDGFIIQETEAILTQPHPNAPLLKGGRSIEIIARQKDGRFFEFNTFNIQLDVAEEFQGLEIENLTSKPKFKKFIRTYVVNLLNLINDPEVVFVHQPENRERNIKRLKRGKPPIPDHTFIKITGERRVQIDKFFASSDWKSNHAWWVRGHWRTLSSPRYGKNQGKRLWIPHHIRGQGKVIEGSYEVESR